MKPSVADMLIAAVLDSEGFELFHNDVDGYASIAVDDHRETWPVRSATFRRWASRLLFETVGKTPGSQAVQDALSVLDGIALFDGPEHRVHLRLAEHNDALWLDLGDAEWRAVRIVPGGWDVVSEPPVRFRRPRGMLGLPDPIPGGTLDGLREYCNVTDDDWLLFQGYMIGALHPRGPYPVLVVSGEQGSAKSTLARLARSLIDPNEAPLRREPREARDLIVAARNSWIVAFDNVSRLSQELSDDLARLATGAGFGARTLYTDLEETIVHVARPAIMNGIEDFVTRGDLLDRSLILSLQPVEHYRDELEFWAMFEEARPAMLGALLDAVATALTRHESTATPNVRMADFARWVCAAEPALDGQEGDFMRAYRANRAGAVQLVLEASIIAAPVLAIADSPGFEGTASMLLSKLGELVDEEVRRDRSWPKRPHVLGGQLKRIAPALRRVGVAVEWERDRTKRIVKIKRIDGSA